MMKQKQKMQRWSIWLTRILTQSKHIIQTVLTHTVAISNKQEYNTTMDEEDKISRDDLPWLDDEFADEALFIAGYIVDVIKEQGYSAYITKQEALEIFDVADIAREVMGRVLVAAKRNQEVEQLEEIWALN